MKLLLAIILIVISSVAAVSCKMPSDDKQIKAEKVNPKDILLRIPSNVPAEEGDLYKITGLQGLISYGDSLLVHVSPKESRAGNNRLRHEANFRSLVNRMTEKVSGLSIGPKFGNLIRLTDNAKEDNFSYYYFEKTEGNGYVLRAFCASAISLHEEDSGCFFGYRTKEKYVQFTLDERTVERMKVNEIEERVFSQLGISVGDLLWIVETPQ